MKRDYAIVAVLLAGAAVAAVVEFWPKPARPSVQADLDLRGKFIGSAAADDAAAFAGVCRSVADTLEADGREKTPRITTGVQIEDVRLGIAGFRFAPVPLRERQPHVRAAVGKYLDGAVGTSGGPVDAATREKWVKAFRTIATAAEEAVR